MVMWVSEKKNVLGREKCNHKGPDVRAWMSDIFKKIKQNKTEMMSSS